METEKEKELEKLKDKRKEISDKIDNCNDYFFIFGWSRQIAEIDSKISDLKRVLK